MARRTTALQSRNLDNVAYFCATVTQTARNEQAGNEKRKELKKTNSRNTVHRLPAFKFRTMASDFILSRRLLSRIVRLSELKRLAVIESYFRDTTTQRSSPPAAGGTACVGRVLKTKARSRSHHSTNDRASCNLQVAREVRLGITRIYSRWRNQKGRGKKYSACTPMVQHVTE